MPTRTAPQFETHGWEGSATGNINRFVGLEADVGQYLNLAQGPPLYYPRYTFLFGPHFTYRSNSRVNPFGHVLVGATHGLQEVFPPAGIAFSTTGKTAFSAAFGGGLDVKAVRFLWFRVVQADYFHESFPMAAQNDLRLSGGVVFRLGIGHRK